MKTNEKIVYSSFMEDHYTEDDMKHRIAEMENKSATDITIIWKLYKDVIK